eukprot:TRINITY_DN4492_c0_g2_i2.p2 TRINITY_DN4492_c0_g2~~TRINITY_DN4492_c0_g2_i2.p2  ORF type:complete len:126 (+),score=46.52 TRINITY_DN4492_c0_g2_i2:84-461(+)
MGFGGKGKGGGSWGGWGGNPWASFMSMGGKGWGKQESVTKRTPADRKVWIGGLPEGSGRDREFNKKLKDHLSQAPGCKFAETISKGTACGVFSTAEEATAAIAMLNGSVFEGSVLEVDVWTKKNA